MQATEHKHARPSCFRAARRAAMSLHRICGLQSRASSSIRLAGLRRIAMCGPCQRCFPLALHYVYITAAHYAGGAFFTDVLPLNRQRQIKSTQSIHWDNMLLPVSNILKKNHPSKCQHASPNCRPLSTSELSSHSHVYVRHTLQKLLCRVCKSPLLVQCSSAECADPLHLYLHFVLHIPYSTINAIGWSFRYVIF